MEKMKTVLIAASGNPPVKGLLESAGFATREIDIPHNGEAESLVPGMTAVVELREGNLETIRPLMGKAVGAGLKVMGVCDVPCGEIKTFALAEGVADLLEYSSIEMLGDILLALERVPSGNGTVLLMDDAGAGSRLIADVAGRFGYWCKIVSTEEDFFTCLDDSRVVLVLLNLGLKGFDLTRFVRRCALSGRVKSVPCIPFKDASEGLYVHEFISGLNRFARVIMSPEEVLDFIVSFLFRAELSRLLNSLADKADFPEKTFFCAEQVQRIYHSMGMGIFSMENIFSGNRWDGMFTAADGLRNLFLQTRGLVWMVRNRERVTTCGSGV